MANVDLLSHISETLHKCQLALDLAEQIKLVRAEIAILHEDPRTPSCRLSGGRHLYDVTATFIKGNSKSAVAKVLPTITAEIDRALEDARKSASKSNKPQAAAA